MARRFTTILLALITSSAAETTTRLRVVPTKTSVWQLTLADLNRDGTDEVLYGGYEGDLSCVDMRSGETVWSADIGGFPYCLTAADLDGDLLPEVLATSASLHLHVFSPEGKLLWKFTSGAPLHAVAAGDVLAKGETQVVCGGEDMKLYFLDAKGRKLKEVPVEVAPNIEAVKSLAIGDVVGDERNELCVTNAFGIVRLLDPRTDKTLWNSRDYKRRFMRDLMLWDADGDGQQEIVATSERVELLGGDGKVRWQATPGVGRGRGYRMPELAPVDIDDDGKAEVAVLYGPELSVFNAAGERVYHQACDFYYFTSMAGHSRPTNEIVIGSVVGADRSLYVVRFEDGDTDDFAAFKPEYGYLKGINATLGKLREQVLAAPANSDLPSRTYDIWVSGGSPPFRQCGWVGPLLDDFRATYPYSSLRFCAFVQYREPGHKGQGNELPPEELLQIARKFEVENASHVLAVAHGLDPFVSVDMVDRWLSAAPRTCRGIMMHENSHYVTHFLDAHRTFRERMEPFIDDFMLPVMDLCLAHGKRFYLMEKQLWWVGLPAVEEYARRIFAEKYRPIIVPMVEESNSRCPELNFVARVGLWRTGVVRHWGMNLIDDQLRTCKSYEYNLGDPSAALRHYVAYAAAGATEFKLGKLMYLLRTRRGDDRTGTAVGEIQYQTSGLLAFDTFMHLLGKGLVVPPKPEEIEGISPVGFRFQKPADGFWQSARMRDPAAIAPASRQGLFSGHDWGFTRPHPYYASAYLMNVPRHCHQFIPENPYGLPLIFPSWVASWTTGALDTDGVHLLKDGKQVNAEAAKPEILRRFMEGAQKMPFAVTGVYWMGRRTVPGRYRVTLVDSGYLTPSDCGASLTIHAPYRLKVVRDALSGTAMPSSDRRAQIAVPAGAFRLVDVELLR